MFNSSRFILVTFVVSMAISFYAVFLLDQYWYQQKFTSIQKVAGGYVSHFRNDLNQALSATYPLGALIRTQNGNVLGFTELAEEMLPLYPGISALQLQPNGVLKHVVPMEGNESAIGHNLLLNPERAKEAFLARDSGKLTLAGPFNLVQGGIGAAARLPVYLDTNEGKEFWGFASALIRFPDILNATNLSALSESGIGYQLSRIHPDTGGTQIIATSNTSLIDDSVIFEIAIPNGYWTFKAYPINGWRDYPALILGGSIGLAFAFLATAASFLLTRLMQQNFRLESLVTKRTRELQSNLEQLADREEKYRTLFESMPQGVFYQRADGELIHYNPAALEMFGLTADEFVSRRYEALCWKVIHEDGSDFPSDQHPSVEALRTGNPVCDVIAGVFNPRKDSYVWLNINAIPQFKEAEEKPYQVFVTLHDITKSKLLEEKLRYLSSHDPLTKLNNRNMLMDRLTEDVYRASRYNQPLSVFMLDIDHFKVVNDSYGHKAGDFVLRILATVLMKSVRKVDYITRYGGEEFVVILPETPLSKAQELAERLRNDIAKHAILIDGHKQLNITASIGVSSFPEHGQLGDELLNAADSAMYSAKADGRNCVRVAETQVG